MKYINFDPKTMKNHGILVHLRHILINFLDFDLILCFWQYVLDPLPPQLLSQKTFFFNFLTWGYVAPSYLNNVNKYTVFFWGYPLVGVSNSDSESSTYPSTHSPGNTGSWSRWVCTLFIFTLLYYCITSICCTSSSCTTSSVVFPFVRSVPPFHSGIVAPSWLGYIF